MPRRSHDSSKTRVAPIFDALRLQQGDWIRRLLTLPSGGRGIAPDASLDLRFKIGHWSSKNSKEKRLDPPIAILSWLIRHGKSLQLQKSIEDQLTLDGKRLSTESALKRAMLLEEDTK